MKVQTYPTNVIIDAAGSGDWFSAGLLDQIGRNCNNIKELDIPTLYEYLDFGLRLSVVNCQFEGARSVMYNTHKQLFSDLRMNGYSKNDFLDVSQHVNKNDFKNKHELKVLCPNCT